DTGPRCRLHRCYTRGQSVVALDLDGPGSDVLLDECLLVGGQPPLLDVAARAGPKVRLRLLRCTLVGRQTSLRLHAEGEAVPREAVECRAWDVLLTRSGEARDSVMVELPAKGPAGVL